MSIAPILSHHGVGVIEMVILISLSRACYPKNFVVAFVSALYSKNFGLVQALLTVKAIFGPGIVRGEEPWL